MRSAQEGKRSIMEATHSVGNESRDNDKELENSMPYDAKEHSNP